MQSRFDSKQIMETAGHSVDALVRGDATAPKDQVSQKDNLKAMMVMGHGGNTVTRMPEVVKGIEKIELLVVADPHPTTWAVLSERKDGTYLLPVATSYEMSGSRTASNRAIQWGEQIVKPIFESKNDLEIMYLLAKKLGFADRMFKNIKVENNVPVAGGHPARDQSRRMVDRLLRPVAGAAEAAHGQPERLRHGHAARSIGSELAGDYYGLPWPCWGTPEFKHPGTPLLYNTNLRSRTAAARSAPASVSSASSRAK